MDMDVSHRRQYKSKHLVLFMSIILALYLVLKKKKKKLLQGGISDVFSRSMVSELWRVDVK